jgi:PKD repeat protein
LFIDHLMKNFYFRIASTAIAVMTLIHALGPLTHDRGPQVEKRQAAGGETEETEKGKDRIDLAMAQEWEMTRDPKTNRVPKNRLVAAASYMKDFAATAKTSAALPNVNWVERGPSNVSGRTRAILIDPNVASGNAVFAGSVGGGLWRCPDVTAANPAWTPINDLMQNLAITAIVADPSNPLIMYAGTGEGYFNGDQIDGLGIFKSINGGTTWAQLPSTNNATFTYCQRLAVNSTGIIFSATSTGGIQRSTNGGTTWARVLGTGLGITGAGSNQAWDVRIAANGDVYATLDGSIHKSTNNGATFAAAMTLPIGGARIELGCAPSDANYVYAIVESGNVVNGILRTTNGGTTWTSRTEPVDADPGIPATDFSRDQAWYDLCLAVDPLNRDRLFVGGIDLFVSGDGAGTWAQVSHWYGGFGLQYVHADQHFIVFRPGNSATVYFGNDGGIYRSSNANVALPTTTFIGTNYNVTQYYACALHPTALSNYSLAGAQDNGTQRYNAGGINATVEVSGGDGSFCHIDQDQPQFQITSYIQNEYFRSTDGGATFTNFVGNGNGRFINPTDYDNLGNRLYCANGSGNYLRWDDPTTTGTTFTSVNLAGLGGGLVSAVTVSPNTANRVFFGTGTGAIVRADNAHTGAPAGTVIDVAAMPNGYVNCIEVETGNDNHILVAFSNYGVNSIWETVNGGTSWTSVEGNLPDMPIRWILLNPNLSSQALIATELGVWSTDLLNGPATVWGPSNNGLANVRTDMLQVRTSDDFVIAATHGRGLYSSDVFTTPTAMFSSDRHVIYTNRSIAFQDDSYRALSWSWNFGDGSPLSTTQHPTHTYTTAGVYNVTLTINGGGPSITKNAFIYVLPDLGTPYLPAAGGNFDVNLNDFAPENWVGTPWERGNSAITGKQGVVSAPNAWVTGLAAATYSNFTFAELYAPSFNMTAAGTYTLSFRSRFNAENGFDGFRVEYSLDKGTSWTPVGTTTAAGWYNFANTLPGSSFPINQAFFSGNVSAAFNLYSRDISFLAGNANVQFKFVFRSDNTVTNPGAAVDDFSITGPVNASSGLPVASIPLQGEWNEKHPVLRWQTLYEIDNSGFQIERSSDGSSFEAVGFVLGKGTSQTEVDYTFEDKTANSGAYYYRYRQIDINGDQTFSNVVLVQQMNDLAGFDVYPSPFQDWISLQWQGAGEVELILSDVAGRELHKIRMSESNQHRLEGLYHLPQGVYFATIRMGSRRITRKLIH